MLKLSIFNRGSKNIGYLYFFIFIGLICVQCKSNLEQIRFQYLLTKSFSTLSDSTFISDIRSIEFRDDSFYFSDFNRGQVIQLNRDLEVLKTFGSNGDGPGEFLGALSLVVDHRNISCLNQGKQSIEIFDEISSQHTNTVKLPPAILGTTLNTRFAAIDGKYFISAPASGSTVAVFDQASQVLFSFGSLVPFQTSFESLIRNCSFVLKSSDSDDIITVSDNTPLIRVFDVNGNLKWEEDIGFIEPIKERGYFSENAIKKPNSFHSLFQDAYFSDGHLYLLSISGRSSPKCNELIVLSLNDEGLKFKSIVSLSGTWYSSFAVDDNLNILAYNTSGDQLEYYSFTK